MLAAGGAVVRHGPSVGGDGSGSVTWDPEPVSARRPFAQLHHLLLGLHPAPCVLDQLHLLSGSCEPRATPPASQLVFRGR